MTAIGFQLVVVGKGIIRAKNELPFKATADRWVVLPEFIKEGCGIERLDKGNRYRIQFVFFAGSFLPDISVGKPIRIDGVVTCPVAKLIVDCSMSTMVICAFSGPVLFR